MLSALHMYDKTCRLKPVQKRDKIGNYIQKLCVPAILRKTSLGISTHWLVAMWASWSEVRVRP